MALFRHDLDGFITRFDTFVDDPQFGRTRFNRPENAGQGRLEGVEAQFTTFFDYDFLPDFARGFGIQANGTYIRGEQAFPVTLGADVPALQRIPGISKYSYNLIGLYERAGLSARLAYNYRSNFVNFFEVTPDGRFAGEFTRGISRLDFSASYAPFENLRLTVDVSNILAKPFRNFRNFNDAGDSFPRDVRFEERIFSLGARFRL